MESPIEPETIPTLRQKITDKTVRFLLSFSHAHLTPPSSGLRPKAK